MEITPAAEFAKGEVLVFINADTMPKDTFVFLSKISDYVHKKLYSNYIALAGRVEPFPDDKGFKDNANKVVF